MVFQKKGRGEGELPYESDVWNIAPQFNLLKVLKPLVELDKFEIISQFGTENIEDILPEREINKKRVEALKRFRSHLLMLLQTCKFILKKEDKEKIEEYEKKLIGLKEFIEINKLYRFEKLRHGDKLETLVINEKVFSIIFNVLIEIKVWINEPLNKAGLIYKASAGLDIDEIVKRFVSGN